MALKVSRQISFEKCSGFQSLPSVHRQGESVFCLLHSYFLLIVIGYFCYGANRPFVIVLSSLRYRLSSLRHRPFVPSLSSFRPFVIVLSSLRYRLSSLRYRYRSFVIVLSSLRDGSLFAVDIVESSAWCDVAAYVEIHYVALVLHVVAPLEFEVESLSLQVQHLPRDAYHEAVAVCSHLPRAAVVPDPFALIAALDKHGFALWLSVVHDEVIPLPARRLVAVGVEE